MARPQVFSRELLELSILNTRRFLVRLPELLSGWRQRAFNRSALYQCVILHVSQGRYLLGVVSGLLSKCGPGPKASKKHSGSATLILTW
jgi:hypothetical protein